MVLFTLTMTVGSKYEGPRSGRRLSSRQDGRAPAATASCSWRFDAIYRLRLTDHRPDLVFGIAAGAKLQLLCFCDAELGEFFGDGALHIDALDGEAGLSAIGEAAPDCGARSGAEVGVGQHDHGVFAAEFEHGGNQ